MDKVISLDSQITDYGTIKLVSTITNNEFEIKKNYIKISKTLNTILESHPDETSLELNIIDSDLKLIIEFMNIVKGIECNLPSRPLKSEIFHKNISDPNKKELIRWLKNVENYNEDTQDNQDNRDNLIVRKKLYDLLIISDSLNINCLLHLLSAKLACLMLNEFK